MRSCSRRAPYGLTPVHEDREGDARAGGRLAVARQRGDVAAACRSWPGSGRAPRCGACGSTACRCARPPRARSRTPGRPASAAMWSSSVHDLARRRAVGAREARAVDDARAQPEARHRAPHHDRAGARRAAGAELRAERLDQRLGVEVVRRPVGDAGELGHRRRAAARRAAARPAGVRPVAGRAADHAAAPQRALELAGGEARAGCFWKYGPARPVRPRLKVSALSGPTSLVVR